MAFLVRIGRSKLTHITHQYKSGSRCPLLHHLNQTVFHQKSRLAENPCQAFHNNFADICNGVRFYAAPIQFLKPKIEPVKTRINEEITADAVRLVTEDGHAIVSTREALFRAKQANLQLVEVNGKTNPPVCKIMDYNKEKVIEKKKVKELSKKKGETSLRPGAPKEIRFSGKTERKDLEMKAAKIKLLMEDGYKVKCTTRGSSDKDVLGTLSRLCELIEDIAIIESGPTLGNNSAHLVVRHEKFGHKKGRAKKLNDVTDKSSGLLIAVRPEAEQKSDLETNEEVSPDPEASTSDRMRKNTGPNMIAPPQENEAPSGPGIVETSDRRGPNPNRGPMRSEFGFPNQGNQPPRVTRETRDAETDGPTRNRVFGTPDRRGLNPNPNPNPNLGLRDGRPMRSDFGSPNRGSHPPRVTRETHEAESGPGQREKESREFNRYGARRPAAADLRSSRQGGFGGFSR